ncbi:GTP 3',8-cyclase MoaA [Marinicella sp. W31]|uniref:GTP 3',8-cyclase MoaA n=1 Tax=Marinicella sp. W31 TaxID=3023713 RepID=UPI00375825D0
MTRIKDRFDRPIQDLRISVMDTCNYRCAYCMPEDKFDDDYQFLRPDQRLSFSQITRLATQFAAMGVSKLRLTGGEPLLRKKLHTLVTELKNIDGIQDIAITTNGVLLEKQLPNLIDAGLNRVTISLDALDDTLFQRLNGHKGSIKPVLKAIDAAINSSLQVKINCVVQKNCNESQILPIIEHFRDSGAIVRFIEFMDVGNINDWHSDAVVTGQDILNIIDTKHPFSAVTPNYHGEVAKRYQLDDASLEFGLITSVSQPFCGDCGRARLSADGQLYTCLFANQGHNLKPLLNDPHMNDHELTSQLTNIWQQRSDRYSEQRHKLTDRKKSKIEMYVIGG